MRIRHLPGSTNRVQSDTRVLSMIVPCRGLLEELLLLSHCDVHRYEEAGRTAALAHMCARIVVAPVHHAAHGGGENHS